MRFGRVEGVVTPIISDGRTLLRLVVWLDTGSRIETVREEILSPLHDIVGFTDLVWHADLDAFCLDFFEKIYKNFTNGMDRVTKMNFLLRDVPLPRIIEALRKRCPNKVF